MITVTTNVHFTTTRAGRKKLHAAAEPASSVPAGRVPRVSKLMALAIRFDHMLDDGLASDLSELARLVCITQPRMTQIMNLNHLAPDIQEQVLHLPPVQSGRDPIHERSLRTVCAALQWSYQRSLWQRICDARRCAVPLIDLTTRSAVRSR